MDPEGDRHLRHPLHEPFDRYQSINPDDFIRTTTRKTDASTQTDESSLPPSNQSLSSKNLMISTPPEEPPQIPKLAKKKTLSSIL
jgi:hypothetical protein